MEIRSAPSDDHDSRSYDLIAKLYPHRRACLSNGSSLWDFGGAFIPIDPHELIPYADVPLDDRHLYDDEIARVRKAVARLRGETEALDVLRRYQVVYPPYTAEEHEASARAYREEIVAKIRAIYGVDLTQDLANDREFKINRIARCIDAHLL